MGTDVAVIEGRPEGLAQLGGGVMALATMPEAEFQRRLEDMKRGQERIRRIQKELMVGPTKEDPEGEDYGVIPGTKKPMLKKAGAEKICNVYGLVGTYHETWIEGDGIDRPNLRVRVKCFMHVGNADGPVVGEGVGAANSWETKHRYRSQKRACPACGSEGTIRKSKWADKDTGDIGWWCKDENCKANFRSDDPAIIGQVSGTVENKDPYEVENTLLKIAKKRSYVDGTLTTTATSGLFGQDLEENSGAGRNQKAEPEQPRTTERVPGEDDAEVVETSTGPVTVGSGEHAAAAGATPNPAHRPQATAPKSNGGREPMPSCPQGHPPAKVMRSKRNDGYFCHACGKGFGA